MALSTCVPGQPASIKADILALSGAEQTGIIELKDVRSRTHNLILQAGDDAAQASLIQDVLELLVDGTEVVNEVLTEAWGMMIDDGLWRALFATKEQALAAIDTAHLRDLRKRAGTNRNRKENFYKAIQRAWKDDVENWEVAGMGEHHLGFISRVAANWSYNDAITLVNDARRRRLLRGGTGRQSSPETVPRDWNEVANMSIEEAQSILRPLLNPPSRIEPEDTIMTDAVSGGEVHPFGSRENDSDGERESEGGEDGNNDDESGDDDRVMATASNTTTQCRCRGLPADFLKRLGRKNAKSAGLDSESGLLNALGTMIKSNARLDNMCFKHLKDFGGHFGLQVKHLNTEKLRHRLIESWEHRSNLDSFKVDPKTKSWWRRNSRPSIEDDKHGVYAFRPVRSTLSSIITESDARGIINEIAGLGAWESWHETGNLVVSGLFSWLWEGIATQDRHIEGVGGLITEEFDMYLHHQAERNGVSNKGWLRTMYHSITQQIIRQDPVYWLAYVCLRPDRAHRLISYPYYAKYAVGGDSTFFRHIDMNVPSYLENGHSSNIIQGSISLDDETEDGCTEILPGFHKNIGEWWATVEERGAGTNGYVHSMDGLMLPADADKYGDFVPVVCNRGDARITMPEIPHGSTKMDTANTVRRTILPWFVAVQEDDETLDNEESDCWSDLALAYIKQTAPKKTPSGLHNKYGPIPYKFPPCSQLVLSLPVSQALVCRTTWGDPVVQACANVLLGKDRSKAKTMVLAHRTEALQAFRVAWSRVKVAEQQFYGTQSFFSK